MGITGETTEDINPNLLITLSSDGGSGEYAQTHQGIRCLHAHNMDVDVD